MTKHFIDWLFYLTIEMDGNLDGLNSETIAYQYELGAIQRERVKYWTDKFASNECTCKPPTWIHYKMGKRTCTECGGLLLGVTFKIPIGFGKTSSIIGKQK